MYTRMYLILYDLRAHAIYTATNNRQYIKYEDFRLNNFEHDLLLTNNMGFIK